jgi:hypothetical protein
MKNITLQISSANSPAPVVAQNFYKLKQQGRKIPGQ